MAQSFTRTVSNSGYWKWPVRVATTANGTLATAYENGDTLDGVTLATGDRILLKNQTTATENGIYIVQASGAPVRADDLPTGASAHGIVVVATEGTANADTIWVCTSNSGSAVVGTNNLSFSSIATSAGDSTTEDTYANRPAAGNAGNLHFATNGHSVDRDDGSAWSSYGPVYKLTRPPAAASWTWVNQDTATLTDQAGGVYLENPTSNGGAVGINCAVVSQTGTWTLTAAFMTNFSVANSIADCGILARESGTDKIAGFRQRSDTAFALDIIRWTSATVQSGTILTAVGAAHLMSGGILWQRIQNNGTNLLFSISNTGQNWFQVGSVALTTAFTTNSDQIGFSVEPFSMGGGMFLISWAVT